MSTHERLVVVPICFTFVLLGAGEKGEGVLGRLARFGFLLKGEGEGLSEGEACGEGGTGVGGCLRWGGLNIEDFWGAGTPIKKSSKESKPSEHYRPVKKQHAGLSISKSRCPQKRGCLKNAPFAVPELGNRRGTRGKLPILRNPVFGNRKPRVFTYCPPPFPPPTSSLDRFIKGFFPGDVGATKSFKVAKLPPLPPPTSSLDRFMKGFVSRRCWSHKIFSKLQKSSGIH